MTLALAFGWLAGSLCNWAGDALPCWGPSSLRPVQSPPRPRLEHWTALLLPRIWRTRPRLPLLQAAVILCFAVSAWLIGDPVSLALSCLYTVFLLTVLVIDLEQRRVLNVMVYPGAVVVALLSLLPPAPDFVQALIGGAAGFAIFLALAVIGRGALGAGDVKLMGVVGLMVGWPSILAAVVAGTLLGAAAALFLLITRRATRKSSFAYAPWLALGALAVIIARFAAAS